MKFQDSAKAATVMPKAVCAMLLACIFTTYGYAQEKLELRKDSSGSQPIEVGTVKWARDFDKALIDSKTSGKPVFTLFQEVPGCSGCQSFGKVVLSHPKIVKGIQSEFVPVLIYNNRSSGQDADLLKKYGEPSWNYQVIRFFDSDGRDIIPRQDKIWSVSGVASRMGKALVKSKRPVPNYLKELAKN